MKFGNAYKLFCNISLTNSEYIFFLTFFHQKNPIFYSHMILYNFPSLTIWLPLLDLKKFSDRIYTMQHCASFCEKATIDFIFVQRISDTFTTSLVRYSGLSCSVNIYFFLYFYSYLLPVVLLSLLFVEYASDFFSTTKISGSIFIFTPLRLIITHLLWNTNQWVFIYSIILFDAIFFLKSFWKFCLFSSHQIWSKGQFSVRASIRSTFWHFE